MKNLLRKAIMLGMTMVLITGLLTGCNKVSTGGQASEEKLRIGCQVDSVDHGLGGNIKACANDNNIFYIDKFSIYKNDKEFSNITASQEIVPNLETCPDFICCTNDKLVYAMSGYALHVLDLNTNTEKKYFSNKHFEYVFARGDEVFVNLCDSEEVYEIIGDNEPVLFTGELSEYGFAQTIDDKINFKINGKTFETDEKNYSYDGQTDSSWKEVLQVGEEPGGNKSTITTDEKGAYILCQ